MIELTKVKICLLGDFCSEVVAHRAINLSFSIAEKKSEFGNEIVAEWVHTSDIGNTDDAIAEQFSTFDAIWIVPASPYENTNGVLNVLKFIRISNIPFLGTCGGYQHAIIEFARNVLGIEDADHAEVNYDTKSPLIVPLVCKLLEKNESLSIVEGTFISQLYSATKTKEMYHCSFGFNDDYAPQFLTSNMKFVVFNDDSVPRALELAGHSFFIGTSYQPERSAFNGILHPVVKGFFQAALGMKKKINRQSI